MTDWLKKIPWGVIAGISGVLTFYLTMGVWGAQFVFSTVNGQTGQVATIFDSWWQILMFVFDIIAGAVFLGSLGLFVYKKVVKTEEKKNEQADA